MLLTKIVYNLFQFYFILIVLRIFLTWIPNIDWYQQPLKTVRLMTDAYLDIFRRVIPPIGMIDFSPIVALLVLQILQVLIVSLVSSFGL